MTDYPKLAARGVHVFAVRGETLDISERLPEFIRLLSAGERKRAERFRTRRLSERFVAAHAMLRKVLGASLQVAPADLEITTDAMGRPYLPDHPGVDFNLSHTDGLSVAAISRDMVGVDVERLRDDIDTQAVSRKVLNAREGAGIRHGISASNSPFFDYWTIKEAYSKALGLGLRVNFSAIDVSLGDSLSVNLEGVSDDQRHWTFQLYGCRGYRLAIAIRRPPGEELTIRLFDANSDLEPCGALDMTRICSSSRIAA